MGKPYSTMRAYAGSMRVAIIAYGHADNVLCLSKALSKFAEVTVIFITSGNRFTASIFNLDISKLPYGLTTENTRVNELIDERILNYVGADVEIFIVRTPTRKMMKDARRLNLECIKTVAQYINKENYDVIHFNGSSGFQLYFQRYLDQAGKVYTIHDYLPHSGEATFRRKWVNIMLNKLYTKSDYEFILHYRYLSDAFSRYYRVNSGRVHTVHCGPLQIYKTFADRSVTEEPYMVLFFGRISPYKGLRYLFSAFSEIRKIIPNARLVVAGKGELPNYSVNNDEIEICNRHIDNSELVRLIRRARIVVAPYTDATHSAVIMTAFAFNKPVVASAVGGIPEVVEDNITGRLVPPRDPQALAKAIQDLLLNRKKAEQIGQNIKCRFTRGKFSWSRIAEHTMTIYHKSLTVHK